MLAAFLASRSTALTRSGVDTVVKAAGARALGAAVAATGKQLAELSEEEVAEGIIRLAAAEAGAAASEELAPRAPRGSSAGRWRWAPPAQAADGGA